MKINKSLNINKKNISTNISKNTGLPIRLIENILDSSIQIIINILSQYKILKIKNFGTFRILKKNERIGRNPKNKILYKIDSRYVIVFRTSTYLKNKLNNDQE
tara:strand:- start:252 stop:560 length:309 start_codon:yes stop_codon:yes gene_type:complete